MMAIERFSESLQCPDVQFQIECEPMSDTSPNPSDNTERNIILRRVELSAKPIGWMINFISAVAGIISLIVILGVVGMAFFGKAIPDVLSNWGGIILGFYFGSFLTLVKDYMGVLQTTKPSA